MSVVLFAHEDIFVSLSPKVDSGRYPLVYFLPYGNMAVMHANSTVLYSNVIISQVSHIKVET